MLNKKNSTNGFTFVELLSVLTIGSILMVLGFVLIQNAQRSARNSDRITDINSINKALSNYVANNNGLFPTYLYISSDKKAKFCSNTTINTITSIDSCTGSGIVVNLKMYNQTSLTLQRAGNSGSNLNPITDVNLIKITVSSRCSTGNAITNESSNNRRSISIQYATETNSSTGDSRCINLYDQ